MPAQSVTLKHVAKRAGVSFSSASRILRRDPTCSFSEETRGRVLTAARELGYVPNPLAQALRSGRSRVVGIFTGGIGGNPVRQEKLNAVTHGLAAAGYQVMVESAEYRPKADPVELLRELARVGSCGLLVMFGIGPWGNELPAAVSGELERLRGEGMPLIGVDASVPGDWVIVDRRLGFYRSTRYLLELGHRRIALLGTFPGVAQGNPRLDGYRQALGDAGQSLDGELVVAPDAYAGAPSAYHWGASAAEALLERRPDVTAMIASNDRVAIGAMRAVHQSGRRIPEQFSLIGWDGLPEGEFATVPLTTMAQPVEATGEHGVRLLLEALARRDAEEPEPDAQELWLEPRLIERSSCGPLSAR